MATAASNHPVPRSHEASLARGLSLALVALLGMGGINGCRDAGDKRPDVTRSDATAKVPSAQAQAATSGSVVLEAAARKRAGIETQTLTAGTGADLVHVPGMLIADPTRVTTLQAPISGRLTALPGAQWPGYGERVAPGAMLAQVSDARPLTAERGGTVTRVGAQPGELVQAGQVLLELTDFSAPLARVIWRADAPVPAPPTVQIAPLAAVGAGSSKSRWITAHLVGPAADADSLTHWPMYLYRAPRGWPGAAPGTPVIVAVAGSGAPSRGLFVPAAAVVQWEGLAWVYIEGREAQARDDSARHPVGGSDDHAEHTTYVRERVDTSHPVDGGWLVASQPDDAGLARGDLVVVRGAQQLLSEEFKSRANTGDEDEQ
jgi:biotin carboxyl carrier protein